jgi:hypothetical protein
LASFQVTLIGRFWVTAEDKEAANLFLAFFLMWRSKRIFLYIGRNRCYAIVSCTVVHAAKFTTSRSSIEHLHQRNGAATPMDDHHGFLDRHSGHRLEELTATSESKVRSGQSMDPMAIRYVEVSNGQMLFVLRGFRRNIAEPLTFRLLPKQLKLW